MKWKSTQRMRLVQYVYESKLSWSFRFWSIFLISQWNRVLSAYIHNTHKNTNWNCWSELPFCYTIVGRCQANTAHNFEPLLKSIFTNCDLQMRKTHHREMPSLSENLHIYDANFYESNFSPIKMTLHTHEHQMYDSEYFIFVKAFLSAEASVLMNVMFLCVYLHSKINILSHCHNKYSIFWSDEDKFFFQAFIIFIMNTFQLRK